MDPNSHQATRPRSAMPPTIQRANLGSVSVSNVPKAVPNVAKAEGEPLVCIGQISTFAVLDPAVRCETNTEWFTVYASCAPNSREQVHIKPSKIGPSIGAIAHQTGAAIGPALSMSYVKICVLLKQSTTGVSDQIYIVFAFSEGM